MKLPKSYQIAVIKEGKVPGDTRTPITPSQAAFLRHELDIDIIIQASADRCYSDQEYREKSVPVVDRVDQADILLGVKEVPIQDLIQNKTYFFFSHTMKMQPYNRALLQAIVKKGIRLIDYEALTNRNGNRVIAFGHFAGMVGAHNALWTYGRRTGAFHLPRMHQCKDYEQVIQAYGQVSFPAIKIVLTGTGRVGTGALQVLEDMGIAQVTVDDFMRKTFNYAVFTQLHPHHYAAHQHGIRFDKNDFYNNPSEYINVFTPFTKVAEVMINGIYWDNEAPVLIDIEAMRHSEFSIEVIADITCDIAPLASVPSTLRPSTIDNPVYGFDPHQAAEVEPYQPNMIDVMAIDNLPNELPRDASQSFGKQFITTILGELLSEDESEMLHRATIAENGAIGQYFKYLADWIGVSAVRG